MKKLLILGSIVSPCPPKKQGGTERVAYYQTKQLAIRGIHIIFVGAKGTETNFKDQLILEKAPNIESIVKCIEFIEIGGGTGFGTQEDSLIIDLSKVEASRKLRLEMLNLALVQKLMIDRKDQYDVVLNNMRGEGILIPLANLLKKKFINVMHLNIFSELADIFRYYNTYIISISNAQRQEFPDLNYLATIYNPIHVESFTFEKNPEDYALTIGTVGLHKNQKDAIIACLKAKTPLVIAGKIRDQDYFDKDIKPYIDGINVVYHGELNFEQKLRLYQKAKVFLMPIAWQEPFGLVAIESLACGTPVIAYPNGGPKEIVIEGKTGFLVNSPNEMAEKIKQIDTIKREDCRKDAELRFGDEKIGGEYYNILIQLLNKK